MSLYNKHPAVAEIRNRLFDYSDQMYPFEFMDYYYNLPFSAPGGARRTAWTSRYISGTTGDRQKERSAWRRAVMDHLKASGGDAQQEDWMKKELGRQGAAFFGHGLPEEISLICTLALESGYKTEATIDDWAYEWLGIDCNGFVNAYLTSLGTFTRPLHNHPSYINVTKPAKTADEIDYDSVIVTARPVSGKEVKKIEDSDATEKQKNWRLRADYRVKQNPGDSGAHILVIDAWKERGKSFWATDQAGKSHLGPECNTWHIVDTPPKNANHKLDYVWRIRKHTPHSNTEKLVFITRTMQTY